MKITHLSNSFIIVEVNNIKICCDPWIGKANYGGWHSFPEYDKSQLIKYLENVDLVYISHLHDDHLDLNFLIESNLVEKKFLIKNFHYKVLVNKLKLIGATDIIELEPYEKFTVGKVVMSILPQMSSNSDDLDEDVEYDLDTSFIISDGTNVFFNQVDNPYSTNDYIKLCKWIDLNYGKITIAALMAGAASEYPHMFLNIDRIQEKENITRSSLRKLVEKLNVLKPEYYFPAGGTYIIPGKLHPLNSLIAQPSINEILDALKNSNIDCNFLHLEGGYSVKIDVESKNIIEVSAEFLPICSELKKSIYNHKDDLYDYEIEVSEVSIEEISELFEKAKSNWIDIITQKNIEIEQDIKFLLYKNLNLNEDLSDLLDNPICEYSLKSNQTESKGLLTIKIDFRSFYLCLIRKKVWNGTIGALCLFERVPNIFYPSVTFSLNYLVVTNSQLKN